MNTTDKDIEISKLRDTVNYLSRQSNELQGLIDTLNMLETSMMHSSIKKMIFNEYDYLKTYIRRFLLCIETIDKALIQDIQVLSCCPPPDEHIRY